VRRPSRIAVVAVALGTVCCVFTAVGQFGYWLQQAGGAEAGGPVVTALLNVALLVSVPGAILAISSVGLGLSRRRRPSLRLGALALVGCLTPWFAGWLTTVLNDL
jgi:hypothetical protein